MVTSQNTPRPTTAAITARMTNFRSTRIPLDRSYAVYAGNKSARAAFPLEQNPSELNR
jgi:hypothetical protein